MLILCVCVTIVLCGCSEVGTGKMTLNDRQKEILIEEGLPTDINELTDSQKESISRIEEMLTYVEEKYDKTFCYYGYSNGDEAEESLTVYEEIMGNGKRFMITVDENGLFEDDYAWIYVQSIISEDITSYCKQKLGTEYVKCFVSSGSTILDKINNISKADLKNNCTAWVMVFVYGDTFEANEVAKQCGRYFVKNGISGGAYIITIGNKDDFNYISEYSYEMILKDNNYLSRVNVKVINEEIHIY